MTIDLKSAAIRAIRTFFQTALGVYLAGIPVDSIGSLSLLQKATAAGLVAALTFIHNALEDVFPKVDTR